MLILSALFFSTSLLSSQVIAKEVPAAIATIYRFFTASIPIVFYNIYRKANLRIDKQDILYLCLLGFFGYALNSILFTQAMKTSSAINGSIISSTVPIFTLILSVIFLRKKIMFMNIIAMTISLFGIVSMIVNWDFTQLASLKNAGDILFVLGVISSSIYIIGVKRILEKYDTLVVVMYMFISGFITAIPFAIPQLYHYDIMSTSLETWIAVLVIGFLGSTVAYSLQQFCIKRFGSIYTSLSINLVPIFVAFFSFILFRKLISLQSLLSMFIVIFGIILNTVVLLQQTSKES